MSFNESLNLKKYQNALKGFSEMHNNAKLKERHRYIFPLREAGITLVHARKLGFKTSYWVWKRCFDRSERSKGNIEALYDLQFKLS